MAKRKQKRIRPLLFVLVAIILAVGGYTYTRFDQPDSAVSGATVEFHFIDVGQGDAALIRTPAGVILIDAGTNSSEAALATYLDHLGITEIAYAVFTHPHEDHIGGADMVLTKYRVKTVILPDKVHTSKTYERMMDAAEAGGSEIRLATPRMTFSVGEVNCRILAPISSDYSELNNYSVVLRADYGDTSVLFTGDAETDSEAEMLKQYDPALLDCDLLKIGHHGAANASGQAFVDAVTPAFGVISCGAGNSYGHPVQGILNRYAAAGTVIYRTDLEGSIVFASTGGEPARKAA